jgi:hypothetical protein
VEGSELDFIESICDLSARIQKQAGAIQTEEATKNAFVKPMYVLIILALMMPAIGTERVNITNNANVIIANNVKIANNAKLLCENSSAGNTTEIILDGEGTHFNGLGLDYSVESGRMLILVDYANHELNISQIDKERGRTIGGANRARPKVNESSFKISGKNLKIIKPCDSDAPIGGIVCKVNFTSRKTNIFSAW